MTQQTLGAIWDEIRQMVQEGRPYDEINEAISAMMPPGPLKPDDPIDRVIAGLPMDPGDPELLRPKDSSSPGATPRSRLDAPKRYQDETITPDSLELPPEGTPCKSTAQLYEEGAFESPGARQYGYAAKMGVLPGFVEGDPEAWRIVMAGREEWDPQWKETGIAPDNK